VGIIACWRFVIRFFQKVIIVLLLVTFVSASSNNKEVVLESDVFVSIKSYDVNDRSRSGLEWSACGYGNYYSVAGFERVIVEDIVESQIVYTVTSKFGQTIMTRGCEPFRNSKPFVADFHSHPRINAVALLFPSDNDIITYLNNPKTKVGCIVDAISHSVACYGRSTAFQGSAWLVGVGDSGWIVCDNDLKDCR